MVCLQKVLHVAALLFLQRYSTGSLLPSGFSEEGAELYDIVPWGLWSCLAWAICSHVPRLWSCLTWAVCSHVPRLWSCLAWAVCSHVPRLWFCLTWASPSHVPRLWSCLAWTVCSHIPRLWSCLAWAVCGHVPRLWSCLTQAVFSVCQPWSYTQTEVLSGMGSLQYVPALVISCTKTDPVWRGQTSVCASLSRHV